jgi:hypothetical protein
MKRGRTWPYKGQEYTVPQLAQLAGCPSYTMYRRLEQGKTPEQAVAMGAAATACRPGSGKRHEYQGQLHTTAQLAALAGCSYITMYCRLRFGYSAAEAVAMGAARDKTEKKAPPRRDPKMQPRHAGPVLAADAPAAANAGPVPVTSCSLPQDTRFAPARVEPVFGALRPGQYLDSETHMSRVYAARG